MRSALLYSHAAGFVHVSIPAGVEAVQRIARDHDVRLTSTDDPDHFNPDRLNDIDVVIFLQTSGDVLPESRHRVALEQYIRNGGGWFGIHAASSIGPLAHEWPWYRALVGAAFVGHTAAQVYCDAPFESSVAARYAGPFSAAPADAERLAASVAVTSCEDATIHIEDATSPIVDGLVDGATERDEWYGFDTNPRGNVTVVATVDESTYVTAAGAMGADHPVIWWQDYDGGRSVYNAMGHAIEQWHNERFLRSIWGGMHFAAAGPRR